MSQGFNESAVKTNQLLRIVIDATLQEKLWFTFSKFPISTGLLLDRPKLQSGVQVLRFRIVDSYEHASAIFRILQMNGTKNKTNKR